MATAAHREAALNLSSTVKLDRHNAVGKNDLEIARAREQKARAELDGLQPRLDECLVRAPFDGRVLDVGVRVHERTTPQKPFLAILDDSRLEIEAIVPSHLLASMGAGVAFVFRIDELGRAEVRAAVLSTGAAVDPVSKTVKLFGVIESPIPGILAGMSGTVHFEARLGR